MRIGRLFKCVLAIAALLSIFPGITALAAGEVTVEVKDVSATAGQTVTAELLMDGSFAAFQGALLYDTDALTLEKIEATSLLSGSLTRFTQDEISGKFSNGSFVSASANNMAVNGAVLKFTFSAGSKADGTYSFSVEQFKVYDEKGEELTINAVDTVVVPTALDSTAQESTPGSTTQEPTPGSATQEPTPSPTTQEPKPSSTAKAPTPTPTTSDPETDNPDSSQTDGINESGDENSGAESSEENTASDTSEGKGWVFILLIILAVVVVGVAVAVIVIKKKKKK